MGQGEESRNLSRSSFSPNPPSLALLTYFHSKVNPGGKKLLKFTKLPAVQAYVVDHDKCKVHFHMSFIDFMKIYFALH